jgi:serine/threonine protein kinase
MGLARQLPMGGKLADGTYKMTGDTGSPRYMAPEVALEKPYNETCDCYSLGILLWQMCSLEVPFEGFTMSMFDKKVVRGGMRPKTDPKWPMPIIELISGCWSTNITNRPSMAVIIEVLRKDIHENQEVRIFLALFDQDSHPWP